MQPIDADFDEILPKGRIVRMELEILLPADAARSDIERWLHLHFGSGSLSSDCALANHDPECLGEMSLTDTREQGRIETRDLKRDGDGLRYRPVVVRRSIDLPPEPMGEVVWIETDGTIARVRAPARPPVHEIMSRLLGNLDWRTVAFEGRTAEIFFQASGWRDGEAANPAALQLLAGLPDAPAAVRGPAMVFVPPPEKETPMATAGAEAEWRFRCVQCHETKRLSFEEARAQRAHADPPTCPKCCGAMVADSVFPGAKPGAGAT